MLSLVLVECLLPSGALGLPPLHIARITVAVHLRATIQRWVKIKDARRDVCQQRPIMAHQHHTCLRGSQARRQEVQAGAVEVVRRLIQQQKVMRCAKQAGEAHPIALPNRQCRQKATAICDRPEFKQRNVNPSVGVPGVKVTGEIKSLGVNIRSPGRVSSQCRSRTIELRHCGTALRQFDVNEIADRSVVVNR